MHEKCLYSEFAWSVFSRILAECGKTLRISPYSVRMQENKDQKNSKYWHFSRSAANTKHSQKTIYRNWVNGSFWIEELKKSNFSFDELTKCVDYALINRKFPITFKNANVTPYIRKAISQIKQIFGQLLFFSYYQMFLNGLFITN